MAPAMREATAGYEDVRWYGLTCREDQPAGQVSQYRVLNNIDARVINLSAACWDRHYNQLTNQVLWPEIHELGRLAKAFAEADYGGFHDANKIMARQIAADLGYHDKTKTPDKETVIFVQDYHHFILPELLREQGVENVIAFFNHTPLIDPQTSSPEKLAFYKERILSGLLRANAATFQTAETARRFMQIMGHDNPPMLAAYETYDFDCGNGNRLAVGHYPISINTPKLMKTAQTHELSEKGQKLASQLVAPNVFINFERCDYTKDIVTRLKAFGLLMERHPELRGQVQITVGAEPTREDIQVYRDHAAEVGQLANAINGYFKDAYVDGHPPVIFLNENVPNADVLKLMRSDASCRKIGCVTPFRDGMNLVAKEFVAAQDPSQAGVLILSRGAGAAHELSYGALTFEPANVEQLYTQMLAAIRMPQPEANRRMGQMQSHIRTFDIARWGEEQNSLFGVIRGDMSSGMTHFSQPRGQIIQPSAGDGSRPTYLLN